MQLPRPLSSDARRIARTRLRATGRMARTRLHAMGLAARGLDSAAPDSSPLPAVSATAPVLVIGIGRSGTTALAASMKRHPAIYGGGPEVHEAPWIADVGGFVHRFHDERTMVQSSPNCKGKALHDCTAGVKSEK